MSQVGRTRCSRAARVVAGAVLLSGLLVGCGRGAQLTVAGLPPPAPDPPAATTKFQGAVASVDAATRIIVVDVSIVWTPVITAGEGQERRVRMPAAMSVGDLLVGGEVQVEALDQVDGVWPAVKLQLLDIE